MAEEFDDPGVTGEGKEKKHFLPINTNAFDRVFIAVVVTVAIHLIWLRFLEPEPLSLPLWIGTAISVVLGILIYVRG